MRRLSLHWRNLLRNRGRNLATGTVIASGFAGVLLLLGYFWQVSSYLRVYTVYGTRTGHLSLYPVGGLEGFPRRPRSFSFNTEKQTRIERVLRDAPDVARFGGELEGYALAGNGCATEPFFARGVTLETLAWLSKEEEPSRLAPGLFGLASGKAMGEYSSDLHPIEISRDLARAIGKPKVHDEALPAQSRAPAVPDCGSPGSRRTLAEDANIQILASSWSGSMSAADAEIVGQFDSGFAEGDPLAARMPLARLQDLLDTQALSHYAIWLKPGADLARTRTRLAAALGPEAELIAWNDPRIAPVYSGTTQFLGALSTFISAVLFAVILLSLANSLTITIIEREQEIGTLRALGYSRGELARLWRGEVGLLSVFSLLAGAIVHALIVAWIRLSGVRFSPPGGAGVLELNPVPPPLWSAATAGLLLLLAVGATGVIVNRATRKKIPLLLTKLESA